VILGIFIIALLCVGVIVFIIYQNGLRYIKSDEGIKFFGNTDKNDNIINGRIWFESDSANIDLQKFYIVEIKDSRFISYLPDASTFSANYNNDVPEIINSSLPDEITGLYPVNNFIFNQSDSGIFLRTGPFDVLLTDYENDGNKLLGGEIYTSNGVKWVLNLPSDKLDKPLFYTDFEILQAENSAKKYKGDILSFIQKEDIHFASFVFSNGNYINLYSAPDDIYRISYDKGPLKGELYIGKINGSFQKNGNGLYYSKTGDIYYGDFIKNERTGKSELFSDRGDSYSGDIENGKKNGEGVFKWSDGTIYTGTFKDNMKNGWGINTFADGSVYEGDYVNDVKQGNGKYTWASGDVYEGDFVNDLYKGKGKFIWANGDYYEGDFNHNTLHGWGTYYWTSGRSYEGWWNLGKMVYPEDKPDDVGDGGENDINNNGDDILPEEIDDNIDDAE